MRAASLLNAAKALYILSLNEKPNAAWHQETLRELALLIEELAEYKAAALTAAQAKADPKKKQRVLSRAQIRAALEAARSEALPHWVKLITQFPKNPHLPEALYHAGVLFSEGTKPNPEKSVVAFERLTKEFPNSPWTGDAHVRLIDVKLEQQFDLPGAEKHAQAAAKWLETVDKAALEKATRPLGDSSSSLATDHRPLTTAYAIYLRAGLIEYLNERCPKAVEWFEKAKPFAPPRNLVVVAGTIPTGIEKLMDLAKSGRFITPDVVRNGDPKAKLILMLVDVYHEGEQFTKSFELCTRLIEGAVPKATREQRSWAYFKRGRGLHAQMLPVEAMHDFQRAAGESKRAPWRPKALLYSANATFNYQRNINEAIALWNVIGTQFPDSMEGETATYYIGFALQCAGRLEEAKQAYGAFLAKYPDSVYSNRFSEQRLSVFSEVLGRQRVILGIRWPGLQGA